eukprot:CAMPEP_0171675608 /NCGR_PEP_ID=MMETSP0990-20121206/53946_1 /TAXON_ID=483369 /ORGANISM="non described non described, Strain CCMP2098" /LENGTH=49 /DNA_ID= /DNA_START= /DNA_END= /DNA_ORIENTATION=
MKSGDYDDDDGFEVVLATSFVRNEPHAQNLSIFIPFYFTDDENNKPTKN